MNSNNSAHPLHHSGWFSLKGRCSRRRFIATYFPIMTGLWLLKRAPLMMMYPPGFSAPLHDAQVVNLLFFLSSVLLLGPIVIRRLHDVGFSAAFYLLGASGRCITLAFPLLFSIQIPPNQFLLLLITISSVWGWLCISPSACCRHNQAATTTAPPSDKLAIIFNVLHLHIDVYHQSYRNKS